MLIDQFGDVRFRPREGCRAFSCPALQFQLRRYQHPQRSVAKVEPAELATIRPELTKTVDGFILSADAMNLNGQLMGVLDDNHPGTVEQRVRPDRVAN
jgi:hypothetical protein